MENGNKEKGNYLYAAGGVREFRGKEIDEKGVVKVDMESGEVEKVVDEFNGIIRHFEIDGDSVYAVGLNIFKREEFYGRTIFRVNKRTGKLEKVVDGFNDWINNFMIDRDSVYVAGRFNRFKEEESDGRAIVMEFDGYAVGRVNIEGRELEKIVDELNDWINNFMIDRDSVYVAKWVGEFKGKKFDGYAVVRVSKRSGKVENVVDEFNDRINHFVIDGNSVYAAGEFEGSREKEFDGYAVVREFDGYAVVRVDMESGEVKKVVDEFKDWIKHFVIDGNSVYAAGEFYGFKEKKLNYAIVKIDKIDMESGKVENVVDGFNGPIYHFEIRSE